MAGGRTGVAVHQYYTTTPTTTAGGEAGSRRATPQPAGRARCQYAAWWCMAAGVRGALLLHDILIQYALFLLVIVT